LVGAGEASDMRREDLFEAWRRFLERLAARYPLVVVLEDIQWADDGLLDFIDHASDWAQGPIMVVATARAELFEKRPAWGGGKRNATSIYLDPLSTAEGAAMLDDLLPGPIEPALRQTIVERSEGNPLYVEEIVRKLIDDGVLRATEASRWEVARPIADIELPRSVQGLIAARLDGLPDDEKAVLQDAAVVGRVFWIGAVAELTGKPLSEIRESLGRLRVKELVVPHEPSSFRDEHEFAFRHALIRDGAYDSLPKSLRADMHLGVAQWAEQRAGDRAEEIAELIATHEVEALGYLTELGERRPDVERKTLADTWAAARRTRSLKLAAESTRWFREAEKLADRLEVPPSERATLAREHAAATLGPDSSAENERVVRRAIDIFAATDDQGGIGWANARLVIALMQQSRHAEAEEAGRTAVATLEPSGESPDLADALHRLGWFLWRRGREPEAEPLLRRAIEMATNVNAIVVQAEATQTLGVCMFSFGTFGEARRIMEEAFVLAKEAGDTTNLMRAYNNLAAVRGASPGPAGAVEVLAEGLELALRSGIIQNGGWIAGSLGDLETILGRLDEAEQHERQAVDLARRAADEPLIGQRLGSLAQVLVHRGRTDEAMAIRNEAAPILAANPEPQAAHFLPDIDGYFALARHDRPAAAAKFVEAAQFARAHSVDTYPEIFTEVVRALVLTGDRNRAATFRDLDASTDSVQSAVHARNVAGLLEPDPARALEILREAVSEFQRLEMRLPAARAMVDQACAMVQLGEDPTELLQQARKIMVECDANLFLFEVDEVLAQLS
jgi:tetratricopeptide (TPR) repeat protein